MSQQPIICQDIFSSMYRLLANFNSLSTAPNTSFSHSDGFQPLSSCNKLTTKYGTYNRNSGAVIPVVAGIRVNSPLSFVRIIKRTPKIIAYRQQSIINKPKIRRKRPGSSGSLLMIANVSIYNSNNSLLPS